MHIKSIVAGAAIALAATLVPAVAADQAGKPIGTTKQAGWSVIAGVPVMALTPAEMAIVTGMDTIITFAVGFPTVCEAGCGTKVNGRGVTVSVDGANTETPRTTIGHVH